MDKDDPAEGVPNKNTSKWLANYLSEKNNSNVFCSLGISQVNSMYRNPTGQRQNYLNADFSHTSQPLNSLMPGFGFEHQHIAESRQPPALLSQLRSGTNSQQQGFVEFRPSRSSEKSPPKHNSQLSSPTSNLRKVDQLDTRRQRHGMGTNKRQGEPKQ